MDLSEAFPEGIGKGGVSLSAALDNIKRTDNSVSNSASEDATYHALLVVGHVMYVTHISALFM